MILTCPECATRYQTDAAHFAPDGRKVRCAKCGHVWFQAAPAPEPEPEIVREESPPPAAPEPVIPQRAAYAPAADSYTRPAYEEEHEATAEAIRPRPRRLESVGYALGWMALLAIFFALGWIVIRFRQDVATLWPQSSSFYAAIGLHVNTRGIEIVKDGPARWDVENGQTVLLISGHLRNITSHELSIPPIRASLSDDDRREVYHWSFSSSAPTIEPGQSLPFSTRLASPPISARHIALRFIGHAN